MRLQLLIIALVTLPLTSHANSLFSWHGFNNKQANTANAFATKHSQLGDAFSIKSSAIRQLKVKDLITINLSTSHSYPAKISDVKTSKNGSHHVIATILHDSERLPTIITLGSEQFFMRIVTPEGVMVGQGKNDQGHLLKESLLAPKHVDNQVDYKIPPLRQKERHNKQSITSTEHHIVSTTKVAQDALFNQATANRALASVDILFVYSLTAQALYEGDITTRLDHIIAVTNQIYIDSGVDIQIAIADTLAVDYPDDAVADEALDDITYAQQDVFHDVESLRFEKGADMVVLLRPFIDGDDACGLAWANSSITNSVDYMYSHTSIDCSDYVNAHELGHNMGLAHSRAQGDIGYTFPYAIGHRIEDEINGFSTVMAYSEHNAGKVYKFSNPEIACTELPCGVDRFDPINGADARFALNQVRFQLENIMDDEPDLTLAIDALSNITDTNLRDCLNNQISNNSITYASQLRSIFCSYRNISSLTGLDSFSGISSAYLGGNNLSDMSPLAGLTKLYLLSLSSNNISDLTPLTNLVNIQILYLDNNNIVNIDALSKLRFMTTLWLTNNSISSIEPLSNLQFLTGLSISSNDVSSIEALANVTSLKRLYASQNNISDISPLANLSQLKGVYIDNNLLSNLSSLTNLSNLEELYAQSNQLSFFDAGSNLHSLKFLNLARNNISQISNVSSLVSLEELSLNANNLTNVNMLASIPKLASLNLTDNNVTDVSPLAQLNQLEKLEISFNPISDIAGLGVNSVLKELSIDSTNISHLSAITQFANLQRLSANTTSIDEISAISKLYELFSIELASTNVTDISPLFSLHNNWNTIEFSQSNKVYCWQLEYVRQFISYDTFNSPNSCSTNTDANDDDQDGISNINEVNNGTNPLYHNEQSGTLQFQFSDLIVEEDNKSITLKVIRENGNLGDVSVEVSAISETATKNVDFSFTSQTLTFLDQQLVKEITLDIIDDNKFDNNETFIIELSTPINTELGEKSSLTVTITDRDAATFGWSSNYAEVSESDGSIFVTIERPQTASGDMSVDVSALDYLAVNGTDYEFVTQTVNFVDEASKTVEVAIIDNNKLETNKGFYLTLSNPVNAVVDEDLNTILINILEDEEAPAGTLSFESSTYSVSEGAGTLNIKVVRNDGSFGTLNANIELSNSSATNGSDFNFESQSITFDNGELEQTLSIEITDDTTDESDETFELALSSTDNSVIGGIATTTITITDNDEPAVVTPPAQNTSSSGGGGSIQFLLVIMLLNLVWLRSKYYTS